MQVGATLLHLPHKSNDSDQAGCFMKSTDRLTTVGATQKYTRSLAEPLAACLVTSANFSAAAWGSESRGDLIHRELRSWDVCVNQAAWPLDFDPFENPEDAATVSPLPRAGAALITWARAAWDGKNVAVDCRCEASGELEGCTMVAAKRS